MIYISKCHPVNILTAYYYIQPHHFHQCSLQSHHSGERIGYMYHCCIEMLHFDRKLFKLEQEVAVNS